MGPVIVVRLMHLHDISANTIKICKIYIYIYMVFLSSMNRWSSLCIENNFISGWGIAD